jgi:predicted transcriptional regulator
MELILLKPAFRHTIIAFGLLVGAVLLTGEIAKAGATGSSDWLWVVIIDEAAKFLTALAAFGAVFTAAVAYINYKSNAISTATRDEIALATAFTELLGRADGRISTVASESAISKLFDTVLKDQVDLRTIRDAIEHAGTLGIGNGAAAQAAAIECVVYFGRRYAVLNAAAREGLDHVLQTTKTHREQVRLGIDKLRDATEKDREGAGPQS